MASTFSDNLKLELIGDGDQTGTWGVTTNNNLGTALEEAIVGSGSVVFTNDANLTLPLTTSNTTQLARNFYLNVTSSVSLSTQRDLVVPTIRKTYVVRNGTTGGQSIRVKTAAGTGVVIPNGIKTLLYVDGTNVTEQADFIPPNGSVTTAKLADGAVTPVKLSSGAPTWGLANEFLGLPAGTTAQRPSTPISGAVRYNTSLSRYEGYGASGWAGIGGGATGGGSDEIFVENGQTVTTNYSIPSGRNAHSVGPIAINSGVSVTVPSGSRWVIS